MTDTESTRELMLTLTQVQTTFRQAIQRSIRRNHIDLTFEMLQILGCLWKKNGVNQQELANLTFKDKASLTSLLNNLEIRKLVTREVDTEDRRNKRIYLTPLGHEYGEMIRPIMDEVYNTVGQKLNDNKVESCKKFLLQLNDAFKE